MAGRLALPAPDFAECFALECAAIKHVRNSMGLTNVKIMVPFVRTVAEGKGAIYLLARNGLVRGENGLEIVMMCELPSNALLADAYLDHVDEFSIGSNDMTQLTLGLDRDSALVAGSFDERDPAVKELLSMAIRAAKARGTYVSICGQDRAITPTWPNTCSEKASTASRSTRTPSWRPGAGSPLLIRSRGV